MIFHVKFLSLTAKNILYEKSLLPNNQQLM